MIYFASNDKTLIFVISCQHILKPACTTPPRAYSTNQTRKAGDYPCLHVDFLNYFLKNSDVII